MPSSTVGTTPVDLAPPNARRMTATIRNESTAGQKMYFWLHGKEGLTTTNADYVLDVGEEKSFLLAFDGRDIKSAIGAVADAASGTVYYGETAEG